MKYPSIKRFFSRFSKNPLYTFVNIFGFAFSMAFVILFTIYIRQETTYDQFHEKKDRLYRMTSEKSTDFAPPVGKWLKDTYPEIENYTRYFKSCCKEKIEFNCFDR